MAQHNQIDHTGLTGVSTVSYASNVNRVDLANYGGAASTLTRGDHVHLGVTSLSHTSNTFSGPVILTASGTLGITSPSAGTLNLSATGAAAGGSGAVATDAIWDAAGDLAVGTGDAAAAKLTIGAAGTLPIVSGGTLAYSVAPTFHGVHAYHNTTQTIAVNTEAALAFNAERFDTDGFHDNVTNNSRLTIPAGFGGKYIVTASLSNVTNKPNNANCFIAIKVNATTYFTVQNIINPSTTGGYYTVTGQGNLVAGDYVQIMLYNNDLGTTFGVAASSATGFECDVELSLIGV